MKRLVISFLALLLVTGCVTAINPAAFVKAAEKASADTTDSGDALKTFVTNYNNVAEDLITSEGVTVEQIDKDKMEGNIFHKENSLKIELNYKDDSPDSKEEITNVLLSTDDKNSINSGEITGELCCLVAGMTGQNKEDSVTTLKTLMEASGGAMEYFSQDIDGLTYVFSNMDNLLSFSINKKE